MQPAQEGSLVGPAKAKAKAQKTENAMLQQDKPAATLHLTPAMEETATQLARARVCVVRPYTPGRQRLLCPT